MMDSMKSPTNSVLSSRSWILTTTLMICMGLFIAAGLYRQQQERETNHAVLQRINGMLALPEEASLETLYTELSRVQEDREESRRARIARQAGMEPDWPHIMERINHLSLARRAELYRGIAQTYSYPDTLTPEEIERRVLSLKGKMRIGPTVQMGPEVKRAMILSR